MGYSEGCFKKENYSNIFIQEENEEKNRGITKQAQGTRRKKQTEFVSGYIEGN